MAYKDEVNTKNYNNFIFNELHNIFYKLLDDFKKLSLKNKELQKLNHSLIEEKEKLQKKIF